MFDRAMEDISLRMERKNLDILPPRGLPSGYSFRLYRPGDEAHWARIETSAGEFDREADAYPAFERYYGHDKQALETRMLFLLDGRGEPIGTATAWADDGTGHLHWVSIHEAYQGRKLCKPLVTEALCLLREHGHQSAFLSTQPPSWVAIRVYLDCGFVPVITDDDTARGWALVRDKLTATDPHWTRRWREPIDRREA